MKLNDLTAALVSVIPVPFGEMNELLRALREQSQRNDGVVEWTELAPPDEEDNPAVALRAKPGPGGGVEAKPFHAGFILVALMLNPPRRETAIKTWSTWHLVTEGSEWSGWGDDWRPKIKPCAVTQAALLGEALKTILANPDLADRVQCIRLDCAGDWAEIAWKDAPSSKFRNEARRVVSHLRRVAELDGKIIKYAARQLAA
jgi:hypothetical protein